jgi:type IV pilus modification protein PilV
VERSILKSSDHRGFTLIEALVAITILAFGLLAVVTMLDVSISAGTLAKNTTKATELASWMMDRIRQDSSLATQPYTTSVISLRTYDNDATADLIIDTDIAADPALEPGRTAVQQWRALIQGLAVPSVPNYMGANQLRGDRLPQGKGRVIITPYDANKGGNHSVEVRVTWSSSGLFFGRGVRLDSVLATAE